MRKKHPQGECSAAGCDWRAVDRWCTQHMPRFDAPPAERIATAEHAWARGFQVEERPMRQGDLTDLRGQMRAVEERLRRK